MKVRLIKSRRRKKTISARVIDNLLEIRVPTSLSQKKIEKWIGIFQKKIQRKQIIKTDKYLAKRADYLYKKFWRGMTPPLPSFSIHWSSRQRKIFGLCQPRKKIIRLSSRLQNLPRWVLDYVILHELAHLFHPNHSPSFWRLVKKYPRQERARGFLAGLDYQIKKR